MKWFNLIATKLTGGGDKYANEDLPEYLKVYITKRKRNEGEKEYIKLDMNTLLAKCKKGLIQNITCEDILNSDIFKQELSSTLSQTSLQHVDTFSFVLMDNNNEFTQLKLPLHYTPYSDLFQTSNRLYYINMNENDSPNTIKPPFFESEQYYNKMSCIVNDNVLDEGKQSSHHKFIMEEHCLFLNSKTKKWMKEKIMLNETRIQFTNQGMESYTDIEKIRCLYFGMKSLLNIEPSLQEIVDKYYENNIFGFSIKTRTFIFIIKNNYEQWYHKLKEYKFLTNEKVLEKRYNENLCLTNISIGKKIQELIEQSFNKEMYISFEFYINYFSHKLESKVYADIMDYVLEYKQFVRNNNLLYSWSIAQKLVSLMKFEPVEKNRNVYEEVINERNVDMLNGTMMMCEDALKEMNSQTPEDMHNEFNVKLKDILTFELFDNIKNGLSNGVQKVEGVNDVWIFILMFYFLRINTRIQFLSIKGRLENKRKNI